MIVFNVTVVAAFNPFDGHEADVWHCIALFLALGLVVWTATFAFSFDRKTADRIALWLVTIAFVLGLLVGVVSRLMTPSGY